jgi:ligand-binding SRPBCC domain-containing protein
MTPRRTFTESDVIAILERLQQGIPHRLIAKEFEVSKKTISRINTGETWRGVSLRYKLHHPSAPKITPVINLIGLSTEFCDLHDEITGVKNHFALSFNQPIYWGWFEGWDGLHSLASDGYIIWESADLVNYAQKIANTKLTGSPVWAEKIDELPTFELETFMTQPVGELFSINNAIDNIVRLTSPAQTILLQQKYVTVATKMRLDIREAGNRSDIVYLTRNKPKSKNDPMPIVIAGVSTVQEV